MRTNRLRNLNSCKNNIEILFLVCLSNILHTPSLTMRTSLPNLFSILPLLGRLRLLPPLRICHELRQLGRTLIVSREHIVHILLE
jgi:hypothetical protein